MGIDGQWPVDSMNYTAKRSETIPRNNDASAILREVADLIESRAADRDVEQERSMVVAVELFSLISGIRVSEYNGWLFMACLKLSRNRVGTGIFNRDHLLDAIAYLALALETTNS